jgi:hypothetical protein
MSVELHLDGHLLPKRLGAGLWQERGISEITIANALEKQPACSTTILSVGRGSGTYLCDTLF